jgi:exodeoxyribonuclease VII large subunit
VRSLSPLETLRRGYAVLQSADGQVVSSVGEVPVGAPLSARLSDGRLDVVVRGAHRDDADSPTADKPAAENPAGDGRPA